MFDAQAMQKKRQTILLCQKNVEGTLNRQVFAVCCSLYGPFNRWPSQKLHPNKITTEYISITGYATNSISSRHNLLWSVPND